MMALEWAETCSSIHIQVIIHNKACVVQDREEKTLPCLIADTMGCHLLKKSIVGHFTCNESLYIQTLCKIQKNYQLNTSYVSLKYGLCSVCHFGIWPLYLMSLQNMVFALYVPLEYRLCNLCPCEIWSLYLMPVWNISVFITPQLCSSARNQPRGWTTTELGSVSGRSRDFSHHHSQRSHNSSVSIVIRVQAGQCRVKYLRGARDFSLLQNIQDQFWDSASFIFNGYQGSFPNSKAASTWSWPLTSI
jgi:hypothetical protein